MLAANKTLIIPVLTRIVGIAAVQNCDDNWPIFNSLPLQNDTLSILYYREISIGWQDFLLHYIMFFHKTPVNRRLPS